MLMGLFLSISGSALLSSCVDVDEMGNDVSGNTEALWRIMDEHYCFFDEKKAELGVDWNDVHQRYMANANYNPSMTRAQLFEFLGGMLGELKDGHVNLQSGFDMARNWSWREDYPTNFSDTLQRIYLGTDYKIASGMYYRILDDNTGYVYLASFAKELGDGNLDEVMLHLASCRGLILDIRSNGGGLMTEAEKLAARFCNETVHVGYLRHKTGGGHNDFSEMKEQYIEPSRGIRWQKKVCVLTNRGVYSAANEFTKYMKAIGKKTGLVTVVGDRTGGGGGMPYSAELPNGWSVRFSACPMYDTEKNCIESGIDPDVKVSITDEDFMKGEDTIIETARRML